MFPSSPKRTFDLIIVCCVVLSGCFPSVESYYAPSAIDGELTHKGPTIGGFPNTIVFEQQEVELEVRFKDSLQLQLFIPEGKKIRLHDPSLWISFDDVNFNEKHIIQFKRFKDMKITNQFDGLHKENILQRNGTTYIATIDTEKAPESFSVKLPVFETESSMLIKFNDVKFEHKMGPTISPIN